MARQQTDSSTATPPVPGAEDLLTQDPGRVLSRAADLAFDQPRPDRQTVTAALLSQERQTKQERQQLLPDSLLGTWQLRFTAPKKPTYKNGQPTRYGFYIPGFAQATISFGQEASYPTGLTIQNQLQVGPVKLRFSGPARLMPRKNLLAFDFVRLQLLLGSLTLINLPVRGGTPTGQTFEATPIGKLPFFAFFAATDGYIAARGRGGGLALWTRKR